MLMPYTALVKGLPIFIVVLCLTAGAFAGKTMQIPEVRWADGATGCTFRNGEDGRSYYDITSQDFEITLAVDRQELEKTPHRAIPMLGVYLTFHYTGSKQLEV